MNLCAGDTIFIPRSAVLGTEHDHHYVVASSPQADPQAVVMLCITTLDDYKDDACVIDPSKCKYLGFIDHFSCIDYREPLIVPLATILTLLADKRIKLKTAVQKPLLDDIYKGATESDRCDPKALLILEKQGLLP